MEEASRRAYLQAMDIDVYYSRRPLPHAAESPRYGDISLLAFDRQGDVGASPPPTVALPEKAARPATADVSRPGRAAAALTESVAAKTASDQRSPAPGQDSGSAQPGSDRAEAGEAKVQAKARSRVKEQEQEQREPRPTQPQEPHEQQVTDGLQFALRCYSVIDTGRGGLTVIEEIPFARADESHGNSRELLLAILRALGIEQETLDLRYESIKWPLGRSMDGAGQDANDPRPARELVHGFIEQRWAASPFDSLLLFSPQLAQLLPLHFAGGENEAGQRGEPSDDTATESYGDCELPLRSAKVNVLATTATHSLAALLAYPQLKRETWQHLQALRKRLGNEP